MKHKTTLFAAFLVLMGIVLYSTAARAVSPIKDGNWNDTLTWAGNKIPGENETINISNITTISGVVKAGNMVVSSGSELRFSDAEGHVYLNCGSITVMPGGKVTLPETFSAGAYITCGEIIVRKDSVETGTFISNAGGLNLICDGIQNEGELHLITSNYITVNNNIVNDGDFTYTGNGIQFYGSRLTQNNPSALFTVSQVDYKNLNGDPLLISGTLKMKGTRFYGNNRTVKPLNDSACVVMIGGYFEEIKVDSMTIEGKNRFYIADCEMKNCKTEGLIEIGNVRFSGRSMLNGIIQPKDYGLPYFGTEKLCLTGDITLNGIIRDTTGLLIDLVLYQKLTNNGSIEVQNLIGYNASELCNLGSIKIRSNFKMTNNDFYDYPITLEKGSAILQNQGVIEGALRIETPYTITADKGVGNWTGSLIPTVSYTTVVKGNHHFGNNYVSGIRLDKDAVISLSNTRFQRVKGDSALVNIKSGCTVGWMDSCRVWASQPITLQGTNSGWFVTEDTLKIATYKEGWDSYYPSIKGYLQTNGATVYDIGNFYFTFDGLWINNGKLSGGGDLKGAFVNNGIVEVELSSTGIVIQNGTWSSTYGKGINFDMTNPNECLLWQIKPETLKSYTRLTPFQNSYNAKTWTKNNIDNPYFSGLLNQVTVADTGLYQSKEANSGLFSGKTRITIKNPYCFISPASGDTTYKDDATFKWRKIPGATGYKIRMVYSNDGIEYTFATDSVMNGDTTLVFHKMSSQTFRVYFSAEFGYGGNFTWSQESDPFILKNNILSSTREIKKESPVIYPNLVSSGNIITLSGFNDAYATVNLIDAFGRLIEQLFQGSLEDATCLNVPAQIKQGLYFVRVVRQKGIFTQKLIVE